MDQLRRLCWVIKGKHVFSDHICRETQVSASSQNEMLSDMKWQSWRTLESLVISTQYHSLESEVILLEADLDTWPSGSGGDGSYSR